MFDVKKCREILKEDGENCTDEEIMLIYDFLKEMAELSVAQYRKNLINEESNSNVEGEL